MNQSVLLHSSCSLFVTLLLWQQICALSTPHISVCLSRMLDLQLRANSKLSKVAEMGVMLQVFIGRHLRAAS